MPAWRGFSDRELEHLQLYADGLATKQIQDRLGLPRTVLYARWKAIKKALRARTTAHAVATALRQGMIE